MQVATTSRDQLLVVALAGWGLRASEVAALHISQFNRDIPDDDVPILHSRAVRTVLEKYRYYSV